MDPVTLAVLTAAAGTGIQTAPKLIKSDLEREQEKRLARLQQRERTGGLGLTEQERAALEGRLSQGARRIQEQAEQERARLLAGGGAARGGQALEQAVAGEQQRMELQTDIAQRVSEADIAERERELSELYDLQAAQADMQKRRQQAVADIASSLLEAGLGAAQQQSVIQGPTDVSPESLGTVQSAFGVTEAEARGIFELAQQNPEVFEYLLLMMQGE